MVNISFTGDILPNERINNILNGKYSSCFKRAGKLKNTDYLIGNLETPVAGKELLYTHERYCFNTPDGILKDLKESGFDMFTLANNHCMDRGEDGILNTLKTVKNMDLILLVYILRQRIGINFL